MLRKVKKTLPNCTVLQLKHLKTQQESSALDRTLEKSGFIQAIIRHKHKHHKQHLCNLLELSVNLKK